MKAACVMHERNGGHHPPCVHCELAEERARSGRLQLERDTLREELMRCGLLAVSHRADGCISQTTALRIRETAYQACWPDDRSPA